MMISVLLPKAAPQSEDACRRARDRGHACASPPQSIILRAVARMIGKLRGTLDSYGEDLRRR